MQPLAQALGALRQQQVIAYPTEGVYGFGCLPTPLAVKRLLHIKRRPVGKGLILIASHWQQLTPYVAPPTTAQWQVMAKTWPGPTTWLVPVQRHTPRWLTGDHPTLAVRLTSHPVASALCDQAGSALISTSANRSGQAPALEAWRLRARFGTQLGAIVSGRLLQPGHPSQIFDSATGHRLR